jgi:peptide/nickel transport system permease protein
MGAGRYLMRRLANLPLALVLISMGAFSLIHLVPGDPVNLMLGPYWTPELRDSLRKYYELDKPFVIQYVQWVGKMSRGDLGRSIRTGEPVRDMIPRPLGVSLTLALFTMFFTLIVSIPLGMLAAINHNRFFDYVAMAFSLLGLSIPNFVLALILILVLGVNLKWLPISGVGTFPTFSFNSIRLYLMPALALAGSRMGFIARLLRSSLLEVLNQDYIMVARAKGLANRRILVRHAARNSLVPLITIVAIEFAYLLAGVVIIEQIFVIPGIGNLLIRAVSQRDLPVVQAIVLLFALIFILSSLVADVSYALADPRIRYE